MKKHVVDQSGFCRHSGFHEMCRGTWETPSAIVTCGCECHTRVKQPSPLPKGPGIGRLVPKG